MWHHVPQDTLKGTCICATFTVILTRAGPPASHSEFRAFMSSRHDFVISVHCHFKSQSVSAEWEGISSPCLWFWGWNGGGKKDWDTIQSVTSRHPRAQLPVWRQRDTWHSPEDARVSDPPPVTERKWQGQPRDRKWQGHPRDRKWQGQPRINVKLSRNVLFQKWLRFGNRGFKRQIFLSCTYAQFSFQSYE